MNKKLTSLKDGLHTAAKRFGNAPKELPGATTMPPSVEGDRAFQLSKILTLGVLLLVLLFGIMLGARLYVVLGMGANAQKNIPLVYLRGESTLRLTSPLLDDPITVNSEISADISRGAAVQNAMVLSSNGRKLLYLDSFLGQRGDLYLRNADREKPDKNLPDNRGRLLADGVLPGNFGFLSNGGVIYVSGDGELLYLADKTEPVLVATQVTELIALSAQDTVTYLGRNTEGQFLAVATLDGGKQGQIDIQIVESNQNQLEVIDAGDTLTYTCSRMDGTLDVKRWNGKEVQLLAERTSGVIDVGSRGELFYTQSKTAVFTPASYFEDDMAAKDAAILTEPLEQDYMIDSKSIWGKVTKVLDKKNYEAAVKDYTDKLRRDDIRSAIAGQSRSYTTETLYHLVGSSLTKVDTEITALCTADATAAAAVYYKERSAIGEKFLLSKVADASEAIRLLDTVQQNTMRDYRYAQLGLEPTSFYNSSKDEEITCRLDGGRGVYYLKLAAESPNGGELFYGVVGENGLSAFKRLDDRVLSMEELRYANQLLYRKKTGDSQVDLCALESGKRSVLLEGLSMDEQYAIRGKTVLGSRNYDTATRRGNLMLFNGKLRQVGTNVAAYAYRTDDLIYLLQDYDATTGTGNLYCYSGNSRKLTLLDTNVSILMNG
ncbi:MAG: hypothetical protein RR276_03685 [Angelakisella sp.]